MYWVADVGGISPSHLEKIYIATFSEQSVPPKTLQKYSAVQTHRGWWCPCVALRAVEAIFLAAWWVPFVLYLHGRRACRSWGPISPCVTPVNGVTLFESGLGPNQPVRGVRAEDLVRCGELKAHFPLDSSWGRRRSPGWQGWEWMACRLLFSHSTSGLSERFVLLPRAENDGLASLLEERML